ncbi:hypothetical protein D3C71_1384880 [compost metagenome]
MELLVGHFREPVLARPHNLLGEALLPLDQLVDSLLQRSLTDQLVHLHIFVLANAERTVGRLILHRRIPPAVIMYDMVGPCEVQTHTAGFER